MHLEERQLDCTECGKMKCCLRPDEVIRVQRLNYLFLSLSLSVSGAGRRGESRGPADHREDGGVREAQQLDAQTHEDHITQHTEVLNIRALEYYTL